MPVGGSSTEAFTLLYEQLKYFHDGLYEGGYKVVGSFLLIIGWIVTSDKARQVLHESSVARVVSATSIVVCAIGSVFLTLLLQRKSAHTAQLLERLNYFPREYYEDRIATAGAVWVVIVIIGVIASAAVVLLLCVPGVRHASAKGQRESGTPSDLAQKTSNSRG